MGEKLKNFTLKHLPGGRVENIQKPYHFIRMMGPSRVGFAEVAVHRSVTDSVQTHPEHATEPIPKPDLRSSTEKGPHKEHHTDWNSSRIDHAGDLASPLQENPQEDLSLSEHPVSLPGAIHSPVHTKGSKYLVSSSQNQDDLVRDTLIQGDSHSHTSCEADHCETEITECGDGSDAVVDLVTTTAKRSVLHGGNCLLVLHSHVCI